MAPAPWEGKDEERMRQTVLEQLKAQLAPYLSLRILAAVTGGLFAIIYLAVGYLLYQETSGAAGVRRELSTIGNITSASAARKQEVEARHQQVQRATLPGTLTELDVYEAMLKMAVDGRVTAQISFKNEATETVGGQPYRVLNFSVSVSGSLAAVESFLRQMDAGPKALPTLIMRNYNFGSGVGGSATMEFGVYTQPKGK